MMSWSSTPRRDAGSALAVLWSKPEWRASTHAEQIQASLRSMLFDDDEVQRLHAAQVIGILEPDIPRALALIHERLAAESHAHVAATLMMSLTAFRFEHADQVDQIVADVVGHEPWITVLGTGGSNDDQDAADSVVGLVLWLAIRPQTANAVALAQDWFTNPVDSEAGRRCMWLVRDWLTLPPDRSDERHRAFELARTAATVLRAATQGTEDETRIKTAYQSADTLANMVYFASGAFGNSGQNPTDPHEGFAAEAFELLELLTTFRHPSIVHHIVETAQHLAPIDPKRAFGVVYRAVRPGEPYSYDSLAANVTISLIERYLADFRDIAVTDHELLSQVRTVLDAFVRVGWPSAVSLSYRLGAAFR
jgi:hypothetical protein